MICLAAVRILAEGMREHPLADACLVMADEIERQATQLDECTQALVAQAMECVRWAGGNGPSASRVWYAYLVPEAQALIDAVYVVGGEVAPEARK